MRSPAPQAMDIPFRAARHRWTCPPRGQSTDIPSSSRRHRWTCPSPLRAMAMISTFITGSPRVICPVLDRRSAGHVQWWINAARDMSSGGSTQRGTCPVVVEPSRAHERRSARGPPRNKCAPFMQRRRACSAFHGPWRRIPQDGPVAADRSRPVSVSPWRVVTFQRRRSSSKLVLSMWNSAPSVSA